MRHQLKHLMCRFRRQGSGQPLAVCPPAHTPQALEQAAELDARTSWPTHRIRSFLLTQRPRHNAG
ncbi:hypothetical protein [Comamonas resistens]|uniref:Uncharacterized protein n=1 Tax=Comamonas resistens TaxID=3046670 RepID=A0ABY8SZ67_9BURK|nr:hypothetical protein [Comamonas resistens]MDL5035558.1 hypothetical protein [Comamonas resistens]WHS68056.1 hypothetical protein QMY55_21230 [Comamonas resistens]